MKLAAASATSLAASRSSGSGCPNRVARKLHPWCTHVASMLHASCTHVARKLHGTSMELGGARKCNLAATWPRRNIPIASPSYVNQVWHVSMHAELKYINGRCDRDFSGRSSCSQVAFLAAPNFHASCTQVARNLHGTRWRQEMQLAWNLAEAKYPDRISQLRQSSLACINACRT